MSKTNYKNMNLMMQGLMEDSPHWISALSNAAALMWQEMTDINWVGFYLMDKGRLVLGPFQGKVACVEIALGKGVCGTAAQRDETVLVKDVHQFPGHIACDCASNSEIVIPIHTEDGQLFGVVDIDSPVVGRFAQIDQENLEKTVQIIEIALKLS